MRTVKFAAAILIITLLAVIVNSLVISEMITDAVAEIKDISSLPINEKYDEYVSLYKRFKKKESVISLTVNHADLTSINDSFAELIGASAAHDAKAAIMIESRLINALLHLKRLSGFNIDSILYRSGEGGHILKMGALAHY